MLKYNPVIAIIVFLCNKWAVSAWNLGDIFIFICSRALYGRFKCFYEDAKVKLLEMDEPDSSSFSVNNDPTIITSTRKKAFLFFLVALLVLPSIPSSIGNLKQSKTNYWDLCLLKVNTITKPISIL